MASSPHKRIVLREASLAEVEPLFYGNRRDLASVVQIRADRLNLQSLNLRKVKVTLELWDHATLRKIVRWQLTPDRYVAQDPPRVWNLPLAVAKYGNDWVILDGLHRAVHGWGNMAVYVLEEST